MDKKTITSLSNEQLLEKLGSSTNGLNDTDIQSRLQHFGFNIIKKESGPSTFQILAKQFKSSLVYLLVIASALAFILHDFNDGIIIVIILIINTCLGFLQEFRSEKAAEKLQKLVGREAYAVRNGQKILINEKLLVPGDIVILREGDIVPADLKLLECDDFSVNESQLTGESAAVTKQPKMLAFAGSVIEQGEAKGIVYATGNQTELGKIAHLSQTTKRVTQFERSLNSFSSFLVKVTFITLAAVFVLKLISVHDTSNIGTLALFIVSLSIAVVPEAMPVIVTVTLSRGALNLARRHVIAKTLTAVEDLGNINVLCSDKTGTLTENKMSVKQLYADDLDLFQILSIACLENTDEKHHKWQSSFDRAFIDYVPQDLQDKARQYRQVLELPFDPAARRRRVVVDDGHQAYLVAIGSAETLMDLTKPNRHEQYLKTIRQDGNIGLRHLAIAYKKVQCDNPQNFDILQHENGLDFVGFVSLEDPLRPSAKHTVKLAENLGVNIKILSGDSREVTGYIANEVGLIDKQQTVYVGDELDAMNDEELAKILQQNNAFARLNPEQKYRIIKLLKQHGNIVGYQGDGINDAPSLKLADVAIAVNNATDVAKESADIILLHSDIGVIVNGIRYGREIFANINKYIRFTFVSNWGNFFALSALYLLSVAGLPILPVQLLLTSLLTDLPMITIATDNVDGQELQSPSKFNVHSLMFISLFLGALTAVFEIMYYVMIKNYSSGVASTGLYLFLTIIALIVIFSIRNKDHFWKAPKLSGAMKLAFGVIAILSISLVYLPATRSLLSFKIPPANVLGITTAMALAYFIIMDTVKVLFYKTGISLQNHL